MTFSYKPYPMIDISKPNTMSIAPKVFMFGMYGTTPSLKRLPHVKFQTTGTIYALFRNFAKNFRNYHLSTSTGRTFICNFEDIVSFFEYTLGSVIATITLLNSIWIKYLFFLLEEPHCDTPSVFPTPIINTR